MTDLAELGLRFESADVDTTNRRLDAFTAKTIGAERAADGFTAGAKRATSATAQMARETQAALSGLQSISGALAQADARADALRNSIDPLRASQAKLNAELAEAASLYRMGAIGADEYATATNVLQGRLRALDAAHNKAGKGAKLQAHELTNLTAQFSDIGVSLASGQNPLMVMVQQGSQVQAVLSGAAARGVGFRAVLGSLLAVAAPLAPLLLAIGAAVAVVGGGFAIATQQINKGGESAKELQKRLGLTDDQMKKVKHTSVTMGDTVAATFSVIGDRIWGVIGSAVKALGGTIASVYQDVVDWAVQTAKTNVMAWGGAVGAIAAAWKLLPAAVGDAVVSTVNFVLGSVEKMTNWVIDKVNIVIAGMNVVAGALSTILGFDLRIPDLKHVEITRIANQFEGAGESFADAMGKGWKEGATGAGKAFDDFLSDVTAKAKAIRDKRVLKEAGDGPKGATKSAAETDYAKLTKDILAATAATTAEASAQEKLNSQVAAGAITFAEAERQREIEDKLRPFRLEADKLDAKQKAATLLLINALEFAERRRSDAKRTAALLQANEGIDQQLAYLAEELRLVGAGNAERAVALAQFKALQELKAGGYDPATASPDQRAAADANVTKAGDVAAAQQALVIAQQKYNDSLTETERLWTGIGDEISQATNDLASSLNGVADSFQGVVNALGGVLNAWAKYSARLGQIEEKRKKDVELAAGSETELELAKVRAARSVAAAQIGAYGDAASAAKTFFKEGSAGYQVMEKAEQAFRAAQFALSIKAMIQNAAEKEAGMKLSFKAAIADTIAGVGKAFGQMGVWGFVGAGAIIATMAALGVAVGSAGTGHGISAEANQERQGTGSVLGDATAKSESIANSLKLVAEHTNNMLEYDNQMLRALRGIESSIDVVAAALARALSVGGALDAKAIKGLGTVNIDRGTSPSAWSAIFAGGGFDPGGLFSGSVTKKLADQGLQFAGQTLGDLLSGGIAASYFQTVETRRKEKAFGMTVKDSIKNKTTTTAVDEDLQRQLTLIVGGLRSGVLAAAEVLGVSGADATLSAFNVALGQISLKGLKGQEITDALNAVFSKLGDDMADAVIPGLESLQKAGEGLFETLMRVARQYQVVDATLASVGLTFGAVGLSSLAARERLVDLFGGLDDFTNQVSFYAENFLTEAERLAPVQAALSAELARLGLTGLDTRAEFKALVESLDLTTAAGAEMFASLMAIAPAFAAITEEAKAVADAKESLATAYGRERDQLESTADTFRDLAANLSKYRSSLYSGPSAALSPEAAYTAAKAEFDRVRGLALTGDQNALGGLQGTSDAFLQASRTYFASSAGYFADLGAVRAAVTAAEGIAGTQVGVAEQQLEQLKSTVGALIDIDESVMTVADAVTALAAAMGAPITPGAPVPVSTGQPASNDNSDVVAELQGVREELAQVREELRAANAQRASIYTAEADLQRTQTEELTRLRQAAQNAA